MDSFTFLNGRTINRLGMGVMRLTGRPGNFGPYPDWDAGLALLRQAADAGVQLFDSARAYGPEHADRILGEALGHRDDVFFATKGGIDKRSPNEMSRDASPERLAAQIEDARRNLRRDRIDLFQLHWVDPEVPLETSVEAMARARDAGLIDMIGLSNVTPEELDRARAVAPIASVQNRLNMDDTEQLEMVEKTRELGIAFLPYGPLGANPMQPGATLDPARAIRWLLDLSPNVIAIPGTTNPDHLAANVAAAEVAT
ncbi:aldo/keto reductase [uncultured Jannaschia sp.]|uniref:aldo/keto reductase n=1 Tax=uncultured Jannaschia sp. TaxID=293347 RepID=UPI00263290C9|nr:aldo/keto reductase [uncultured Jannaschia sp.]